MIENLKTALILCAGYGTRLRPLTDKLPKPLLPVRGKPAIFAVMDKLRAAGVDDFLINVHHLPEKFAEIFGLPPDAFKKERLAKTQYCGSSVRLVFEPQILDTGGAVKNILPLIDNSKPLVVHNGDIYFDCPADEFLSAAQENVSDAACAATLCLRSGGNMPNVGVDALGNVCDMRFALAAPHEKNAQYAGFFVLNPPIFDRFRRAKADKFSVVDIFLDVLRSGERIAGFFADGGEWADIGTLAEYARLNSRGLPDEWAALAELCECGFEPNEASIRKVAKGASTRAFYRFSNGGEKLVGCFYSDLPRENFLYAPIAEFLYSCGVPVPKILFHDAQKRIIVMVNDMAQKLSLKNAIGLHARIEEQKDCFDYCTGRSVCALPMFFKFVRNKIRRGKNGSLDNGVIYFKGGELEDELAKKKILPDARMDLEAFFGDPRFEGKSIVHFKERDIQRL